MNNKIKKNYPIEENDYFKVYFNFIKIVIK